MKKAERALKDIVGKLAETVGELKDACAKHARCCLKVDTEGKPCADHRKADAATRASD